jgi:hypothetical protein
MTEDKLKLVIERGSRYMPCSLNKSTINDIDADKDDFGETEQDPQREQYTCDNRRFVPKLPTQELLNKYNIDLNDYAIICNRLECALYVGHCGMCI